MNNQNNGNLNGKKRKSSVWLGICAIIGAIMTTVALKTESIFFIIIGAVVFLVSTIALVVVHLISLHSNMQKAYDKVDPERKVYSHTGNFVRTVLQVISFVVAVFGSSAIVYKINAEAVKDALLSGNTDKKVFASEGYFDVISNATGNPVLFFVFFFIIFLVLCLLIAFYDRAKLKDAEEARKRMENREKPEK